MFSRRVSAKEIVDDENPFLLSFSDLMASLLAIFILALIITLIELEKRKDELQLEKEKIKVSLAELIGSLEEIQQVQKNIASSLEGVSQRERSLSVMLEGIQKDLKDRGIEVAIAENGTILRIPEQQLQFALGKYEIPQAYSGSAGAIGHALLKALTRTENRVLLDTVFIEGHTDSVPNTREMGNWGLSTYRAISLWNFWTDKPGEVASLKNLLTISPDSSQPPKPLISVSGYADLRSTHGLIEGQLLIADRPEDRRIDIRFTLVSSEKKSLKSLQDEVKRMSEKTGTLIDKLKRNPNSDDL